MVFLKKITLLTLVSLLWGCNVNLLDDDPGDTAPIVESKAEVETREVPDPETGEPLLDGLGNPIELEYQRNFFERFEGEEDWDLVRVERYDWEAFGPQGSEDYRLERTYYYQVYGDTPLLETSEYYGYDDNGALVLTASYNHDETTLSLYDYVYTPVPSEADKITTYHYDSTETLESIQYTDTSVEGVTVKAEYDGSGNLVTASKAVKENGRDSWSVKLNSSSQVSEFTLHVYDGQQQKIKEATYGVTYAAGVSRGVFKGEEELKDIPEAVFPAIPDSTQAFTVPSFDLDYSDLLNISGASFKKGTFWTYDDQGSFQVRLNSHFLPTEILRTDRRITDDQGDIVPLKDKLIYNENLSLERKELYYGSRALVYLDFQYPGATSSNFAIEFIDPETEGAMAAVEVLLYDNYIPYGLNFDFPSIGQGPELSFEYSYVSPYDTSTDPVILDLEDLVELAGGSSLVDAIPGFSPYLDSHPEVHVPTSFGELNPLVWAKSLYRITQYDLNGQSLGYYEVSFENDDFEKGFRLNANDSSTAGEVDGYFAFQVVDDNSDNTPEALVFKAVDGNNNQLWAYEIGIESYINDLSSQAESIYRQTKSVTDEYQQKLQEGGLYNEASTQVESVLSGFDPQLFFNYSMLFEYLRPYIESLEGQEVMDQYQRDLEDYLGEFSPADLGLEILNLP